MSGGAGKGKVLDLQHPPSTRKLSDWQAYKALHWERGLKLKDTVMSRWNLHSKKLSKKEKKSAWLGWLQADLMADLEKQSDEVKKQVEEGKDSLALLLEESEMESLQKYAIGDSYCFNEYKH